MSESPVAFNMGKGEAPPPSPEEIQQRAKEIREGWTAPDNSRGMHFRRGAIRAYRVSTNGIEPIET